MKKVSRRKADELRAEYDLAALGPGARGKYADRLKNTTFVALRPEVAQAFPTSEAVNEALGAVMRATAVIRRSSPAPRRTSPRRSHSKA